MLAWIEKALKCDKYPSNVTKSMSCCFVIVWGVSTSSVRNHENWEYCCGSKQWDDAKTHPITCRAACEPRGICFGGEQKFDLQSTAKGQLATFQSPFLKTWAALNKIFLFPIVKITERPNREQRTLHPAPEDKGIRAGGGEEELLCGAR